MALSREVNHLGDLVLVPDFFDHRFVADVGLHKHQPRAFEHTVQVGQIPRVGELVQRDQLNAFTAPDEHAHKIGPNKPGCTGD